MSSMFYTEIEKMRARLVRGLIGVSTGEERGKSATFFEAWHLFEGRVDGLADLWRLACD